MAQRRIWLSVLVRVVVCLAFVGVAIGVFRFLMTTAPKPVVSDHGSHAVRVLALRARPTPVQRQWNGYGAADAVHAADVPSRVTATVIERSDAIRAGRAVAQGDVLVSLDDSDFVHQVEIASQTVEDLHAQVSRIEVERKAWTDRARVIEEELQLARAEYDRAARAMEDDAAKQREVDLKRQAMLEIERTAIAAREELDKVPLRKASLEAQLAREGATLALARQNAERCRIVAPIDGVLAIVDVDAGESVTAGQRVARIVNLARVEVPLLLPSSARPLVRIGDEVTLLSDSGSPALSWPAQVSRIAPDDDASTRTMRVFAEVIQDASKPGAGLLAPGMFVQGLVTGGEAKPRSVVPRRAISSQRIMLVEDGRVRSMQIEVDFHLQRRFEETGLLDTQWAVLREPLPPDAIVLVDGSRALAHGLPVEPIFSLDDSQLTIDDSPSSPPTSERQPAVPVDAGSGGGR